MNERIAKRLGWYQGNNVGDWYATPQGQRLSEPPEFDADTEYARDIWHGARGVLDRLYDLGLIEAFSEAMKAGIDNPKAGRLSTTAFGVACVLAKPAELSAAFVRMMDGEDAEAI